MSEAISCFYSRTKLDFCKQRGDGLKEIAEISRKGVFLLLFQIHRKLNSSYSKWDRQLYNAFQFLTFLQAVLFFLKYEYIPSRQNALSWAFQEIIEQMAIPL